MLICFNVIFEASSYPACERLLIHTTQPSLTETCLLKYPIHSVIITGYTYCHLHQCVVCKSEKPLYSKSSLIRINWGRRDHPD
jgi:hypothetical protein